MENAAVRVKDALMKGAWLWWDQYNTQLAGHH